MSCTCSVANVRESEGTMAETAAYTKVRVYALHHQPSLASQAAFLNPQISQLHNIVQEKEAPSRFYLGFCWCSPTQESFCRQLRSDQFSSHKRKAVKKSFFPPRGLRLIFTHKFAPNLEVPFFSFVFVSRLANSVVDPTSANPRQNHSKWSESTPVRNTRIQAT